MSTFEVFIRLLAATLAGAALGLNRDLRAKPTGVRTLGVVGLGSALAVMAGSELGGNGDASRVMQGIVTGIGFLGAGVIVRPVSGMSVHGLTTAACTWLTACLGIVCGVGAWRVVVIGLLLTFIILVWGGPLEKRFSRAWRSADTAEDPD
jgi:putative Mg2+ transporter-C (MgtC) family protein